MIKSNISDSVRKLDEWIVRNDWKAYDPFDGLSASLFGLGNISHPLLKIVLQQSVRRFPLNLRPMLGIKPATSSKGMGFCALGYLKLFHVSGSEKDRDKIRHCLDWLIDNYCTSFSGRSWGNHFNYASRGGSIRIGVPTIVWTSLIANVFLDAYEALGDEIYLRTAEEAGHFILTDLSYYEASDGSLCFMYVPTKKNDLYDQCVHNSNVLGGWLLSRLYRHTGDHRWLTPAQRAISFTANRQLSNGAWYYGEPRKFHWIDSFHTGYVLESIHGYAKATSDSQYDAILVRGYEFFKSTFFEPDGTPRYYDHKTYPIDIQCASQGIQTLVNLREYDKTSLDLATKVAEWTVGNMQNSSGYFYYRKYPGITNRTATFHWGQATMLAALGALLAALSEQ